MRTLSQIASNRAKTPQEWMIFAQKQYTLFLMLIVAIIFLVVCLFVPLTGIRALTLFIPCVIIALFQPNRDAQRISFLEAYFDILVWIANYYEKKRHCADIALKRGKYSKRLVLLSRGYKLYNIIMKIEVLGKILNKDVKPYTAIAEKLRSSYKN